MIFTLDPPFSSKSSHPAMFDYRRVNPIIGVLTIPNWKAKKENGASGWSGYPVIWGLVRRWLIWVWVKMTYSSMNWVNQRKQILTPIHILNSYSHQWWSHSLSNDGSTLSRNFRWYLSIQYIEWAVTLTIWHIACTKMFLRIALVNGKKDSRLAISHLQRVQSPESFQSVCVDDFGFPTPPPALPRRSDAAGCWCLWPQWRPQGAWQNPSNTDI